MEEQHIYSKKNHNKKNNSVIPLKKRICICILLGVIPGILASCCDGFMISLILLLVVLVYNIIRKLFLIPNKEIEFESFVVGLICLFSYLISGGIMYLMGFWNEDNTFIITSLYSFILGSSICYQQSKKSIIMSRRLPVYILIDTSGSMQGKPIGIVKEALSKMLTSLRQNPYALETVSISIITCDKEVKQIIPLTEIKNNIDIHNIQLSDNKEDNFLGNALQSMCRIYDLECDLEFYDDPFFVLFTNTDHHEYDYAINKELDKRRFRLIAAFANNIETLDIDVENDATSFFCELYALGAHDIKYFNRVLNTCLWWRIELPPYKRIKYEI